MSYYIEKKLSFHFMLNDSAKLEVESIKEYHCDDNDKCESFEHYRSDRFCKNCGQEIVTKIVSEKNIFIKPNDFCEKYLESSEVVCGDHGELPDNIWLYNYHLPDSLSHYELNENWIDIGKLNIENGIQVFSRLPKVVKFMNKFKEVYGEDSIKVIYGLVTTGG